MPAALPKPLIAVWLLLFAAWSTYATFLNDGYWSVFPPFETLAETQVFSDLGTALTLFLLWALADLGRQGRSRWWALALALGIAASGSIAALSYLLLRRSEPVAPES